MKNNSFKINQDKLTILAGPCVIESVDIVKKTAENLKKICLKLDIDYVFKASFDKANRTSIDSFRGPGLEKGLKILQQIKDEFELPIVTDIHLPEQAAIVSEVADIIQIPAFLCRQTDILVAAAKTNKYVNIKKGQFLAPQQMCSLIKKVEESGNKKILLTERGTSFGYNNLVVDFRSVMIMQQFGYPIVFDATHSVQLPGANGTSTGGDRKFVPMLAKAAVTCGVKILFFEIHPNPDKALCDGDNMIELNKSEKLFRDCKTLFEVAKQ